MKVKKSNIEKYYTYKTRNGLNISFIKREKSSSFHMAMLINYGGMDNQFINATTKTHTKTPRGIAHFLEHKMFESKNKDTFERFSKQSASINAFTTATATVYYFSCTDKVEENIKLFLEKLSDPYITPENTEKEKGIITQEINMYKDNPFSRVYDNLLKAMYFKNPVRHDVAGEVSDIEKITYETLIKCYESFYNCKNMELFIVGEYDPVKLFTLIETCDDFIKGDNILKVYPNESLNVKDRFVEEEMLVSDKNFLAGFKMPYNIYKGREILKKESIYNMILEYLCGNMSLFYEKLYNEGVLDPSFGYGVNIHNKFAFNVIGGVSNNPKKVLEDFNLEILNTKKNGIEKELFLNIKKMMLGSYTRIFDDGFSLLNNVITAKNKGACFLEIIDIINNISLDDINKCISNDFSSEKTSLSVINPKPLK